MDPDFWHARWADRNIGFDQATPNSLLTRFWPAVCPAHDATVFVPLAGKSIDMRWLRERGHSVLGVELSATAVGEFFEASGLTPRRTREDPFEVWEAEGYRILQGDFFALRADHLAGVRAVYDRAAFIALPPEMRRQYVAALSEKLPAAVSVLLIAMETAPASTGGPPFSVFEREVRELYERAFAVELLERTGFDETARDGTTKRANVAYALRR
jgi:thiopurine S-methyltransferase